MAGTIHCSTAHTDTVALREGGRLAPEGDEVSAPNGWSRFEASGPFRRIGGDVARRPGNLLVRSLEQPWKGGEFTS